MPSRGGRPSVADRLVADPLAAVQPVGVAVAPADEDGHAPAAAPDLTAPEVDVDLVGTAAGVDEVRAVAGVDEVLAGATVDAVDLRGRLPGGLVIAPQH